LWISNGAVILCGPEDRAWTFELPIGLVAVGVRFRPGVLSPLLGIDVSTIRNRRLPWSQFVGRDGADKLLANVARAVGRDLESGRRVLEDAVSDRAERIASANDPLAERVLDALTASPELSQSSLAERVGLSSRQLHRRSLRLFGYGTSTLARILRMQRLLAVASTAASPPPLAELAVSAGYADQPHLTRDCRAITGLTPMQFLADYFPTFPDMSDPFKTPTPLSTIVAR
jgi:AraC-like DNA-binding protein